jgi:single-strand DNA-binding protein
MNVTYLDGRIGQDPSLRFTQGGTAVMNFSMATTENRKQSDETWKEFTEWHAIVVWGKRAESLSKMLKKGSKVTIVGSIRSSEWTDKEGNVRKKFEIHAQEVIPQNGLIPREGQSTQHHETHGNDYQSPAPRQTTARQTTERLAQPNQTPQAPVEVPYDDGDDIPF